MVEATSLFCDGELAPAESIIRAFLLKHGNHIEAMRLLARIGLERDVLDDAELLLEAVLKLAPDYRAARFDYARTLYRRQKCAQSRTEMEQLLVLDPRNHEYLKQFAASCVGLGDYEPIIELYRRLLSDTPPESGEAADLHLWIAHALKTLGRQPEAIEDYRAALAARPDFGEAWWSLANLKTYRFSDDDIARMRAAQEAHATTVVNRYHLCFALGKALEDRAEYELSWRYYERGNALKHDEVRYLPEITEINTRLSSALCTREFFDARRGWGDPAPDPIFVLGLPRSGSTLIEQILASHSQVEGTQELADIQRIVMELRGRAHGHPQPALPGGAGGAAARGLPALRRTVHGRHPGLPPERPAVLHRQDAEQLPPHRSDQADAAEREDHRCAPRADGLLFRQSQAAVRQRPGVQLQHRRHRALLPHVSGADAALGRRRCRARSCGSSTRTVVDDLEGSVRRILDFCGLPFEAACLEFHKTERSVRTASSEQVRQPIFRDGLEQWKNYEPWLGPLKDALGDALVRYRE